MQPKKNQPDDSQARREYEQPNIQKQQRLSEVTEGGAIGGTGGGVQDL